MINKKIIAIISAAALSVGTPAVSAFAADTSTAAPTAPGENADSKYETVIKSDTAIDFKITDETGDGYQYAGYVGSLTDNTGDILAIDITVEENTDLSGLRFEFTSKTCWASQNDQGVLYTVDGKTLAETEFTAGETKTVYIDLTKSGASASDFHVHTNGKATGAFKMENITLMKTKTTDDPSTDDPVGDDPTDPSDGIIDFTPSTADYEYAGYVGNITGKTGDVLAMDITVQSGTNLEGLRFEYKDDSNATIKTCWASENEQGTLYTVDGKKLVETEFTAGEAKTVYIDLTKSGAPVRDFHVHTNGNATGAFKLSNIKVMNLADVPGDDAPDKPSDNDPNKPAEEDPNLPDMEDTGVVSDAVIDFKPTVGAYEYAGYVGAITGNAGDVMAIDITTQDGTDLATLRFEFTDPKKVCWAAQNDEGTLYTVDGKTLAETKFTAGETKTVYIDLKKSGVSASDFHVHTDGTITGAFKLSNIRLMKLSNSSSGDLPGGSSGGAIGDVSFPSAPSDSDTSGTAKPETTNTFTDKSGDKAADVQIIDKSGAIPKEASFSVRVNKSNSTDTRVAYDLSFILNDATYQPNGMVTVKIPVPTTLSANVANLKVYHLFDGKYIDMNAKVENGHLIFDTDHFSIYIVTAENLTNTGSAESSDDPGVSDKDNPDTGVPAVASVVCIAALASSVLVVAKKRK